MIGGVLAQELADACREAFREAKEQFAETVFHRLAEETFGPIVGVGG